VNLYGGICRDASGVCGSVKGGENGEGGVGMCKGAIKYGRAPLETNER
jgi:hypothetical protein